jgi:hypothetical protein
MVGVVAGLALIAFVPGSSWWTWWQVTHRDLSGEKFEKVRTNVGLGWLALGLLTLLGAGNAVLAVVTRDPGDVTFAGILLGAAALALPAQLLTRRHLAGPRPAPSPDLKKRLSRSRRWELPIALGVAVVALVPVLISGPTLAGILLGPVMAGVFLYGVLVAMRVLIERSVNPSD